MMMYSAPVYDRLFHVSQLTAPSGQLAESEVHQKVNTDESPSSLFVGGDTCCGKD